MNLQEVLNAIPLSEYVKVISHTPKIVKYAGVVNELICRTFLIHGRKVMKIHYSKKENCIIIEV